MGTLTNSQPWLNQKGQPLSDKKIKKISQNWSAELWENYLTYLESPRNESLVDSDQYLELREISNVLHDHIYHETKNEDVRQAIKMLTKKQQKIIFLIFWEGLSVREIALRMNITHSAVHDLKLRALNSLKEQMQGADTLRIMRGKNSKPFLKRGDNHAQPVNQTYASKAS